MALGAHCGTPFDSSRRLLKRPAALVDQLGKALVAQIAVGEDIGTTVTPRRDLLHLAPAFGTFC